MTTDFRAMCAELVATLAERIDDKSDAGPYFAHAALLLNRARSALADEPASVVSEPSDEEIMELWHGSDWYNEGATLREFLSIARAVLARWGSPAPQSPAEGEVEECTAELEEQKPRPDYDRVQKVATEAQIRSAAQYLAKKQHCDGDLIPAIRYAIARWGHRPAPPAEGEVAMLVARLLDMQTIPTLEERRLAADLLQRLSPPQPVPVSERLPAPEDCEDEGWAWFFNKRIGWRQAVLPVSPGFTHWLPAHALPLPTSGEEES